MRVSKRKIRLAKTALAVRPKNLPAVGYEYRGQLPEIPAVYIAVESGRIVYVGQTVNLRRRWIYHHLNHRPCTVRKIKIAYLFKPKRFDREYLESLLIITLRPKLNGNSGVNAHSDGIISSNLRSLLLRARSANR